MFVTSETSDIKICAHWQVPHEAIANSSYSDTPSVRLITALIFAVADIPKLAPTRASLLFSDTLSRFFFPVYFLPGLILIKHLRCTFQITRRGKIALISIFILAILTLIFNCQIYPEIQTSFHQYTTTWCTYCIDTSFAVSMKEKTVMN